MIKIKDTMRGGRLCKGNFTDFVLVCVFITLAYVFIQRKGYMNKVDSVIGPNDQNHATRELQGHVDDGGSLNQHGPRGGGANGGTLRDPLKIDDRINRIPDVRSKECLSQSSYSSADKVSIIITFFDYQFYDLKSTIDSVRLHTPSTQNLEIVIVDDGSTLDYIKEDSKLYAEKITNGKLIRMEQRGGTGKARTRGAHAATSEFIIFLDTNTVVTAGWIEPLIDLIQREETTVAVPHYDNVNDPVSYEYSTTSNNLITVFTWSLTMRMYQNSEVKTYTEPIHTPVLRGNAFAMHKQMFIELGSYDQDMRDFAAENLEFSFRTWLCGGKIKIVPCSRVGILHLRSPAKIMKNDNIKRISDVWLGDKKKLVYKSTSVKPSSEMSYEGQIITAMKSKYQQKNCKTFDWYLSNVANRIYTPSFEAQVYGLLKVASGGCAKIGSDKKVDLNDCKPESYQLHPFDRIFELTDSGLLRNGDQCLEVQTNAYVLGRSCDSSNTKQKWLYHADEQLKNVWSGYCAMHVTDPDKSVQKGRQIFMVQECTSDKEGEFTKWQFLSP